MYLKYNQETIFPSHPEPSFCMMVCFGQKSEGKSTIGQSQHSQHLFDMKSRQLRAICALIGSWYQRQRQWCGSTHLFNRMVSVRADCMFIMKPLSRCNCCIPQWQHVPKKEEMTKRHSVVCSTVQNNCSWGCLELQKIAIMIITLFVEILRCFTSSQIYFLSNSVMGTLGGLIKRDKEATKVPSWAMIA